MPIATVKSLLPARELDDHAAAVLELKIVLGGCSIPSMAELSPRALASAAASVVGVTRASARRQRMCIQLSDAITLGTAMDGAH